MKNQIQSFLMVLLCLGTLRGISQTPIYSSYPSATPVIFLDFDGHTVNGTSWNISGPIVCGGSGLNQTQVTEVFNRVAEDYRPFNLNITTDSTKYLAAPANRRMRVVVTTTSDWYGSSSGGVAFVSSFTWGDNTPCFIFSALLNYNVKYISEGCAHEAGHTLGLRHQSTYDSLCNKISDYNYGQGSGEIGWAPIMGVGYYKNFTLWHNGPNSLACNSIQNDLSVITAAGNGIIFRSDDYSSSFGSATNANFSNNLFSVNGVVEQNTDQDLFKFTMPSVAGFRLDAIPYNVGTGDAGSNLDLQVTLYNNAQVVVGTYNPGTLLSSIIDTTLNAGDYYLKVEGKGNIYAPSYASLGSYALQGLLIQGTLPVHKLELKGTFIQDSHLLNWIIEADEAISEQVLEISTNGRNFSPLVHPANTDRSYSYRPTNINSALYRINVKFDNNIHFYSNVVTIKQPGDAIKPKLVSNMISNGMIIVSSPANYDYVLIDMNGRSLNKGRISNGMNMINTGVLVSGMYFIRFTDGGLQWTEKIVKQ